MNSRRQRNPSRVFVAGGLEDVPAIEQVLSTLDPNAYGQVFVEALGDDDVRLLSPPPRVTVTWLVRSTRTSRVRPLLFSEHGEALAEAIGGWVAEWMPEGLESGDECLMWVGCASSSMVGSLFDRLCGRLGNLRALPEYH
ncbi:MAG: SIP domain-containing protein [Galbitalea sp.]